ncbi:MAG TPA: hypothetical protein VF653_10350, partial [Methylomirabilota bacterium]
MWTELHIGKDAFKRRWALTKFPFLLGMDMANIFDELAQRSEGQIRSFEPIFPRKGIRHERLYDTFLHSLPAQRTRAIEHKEHGAEYRERVLREMPALRKKHRDRANAAKSRGETEEYEEWHTIQDC